MANPIKLPNTYNGYLTSDVLSQVGLTQASLSGYGTLYKDSVGNYYTFNGSMFMPNDAATKAAGGTPTATTTTPTGTTAPSSGVPYTPGTGNPVHYSANGPYGPGYYKASSDPSGFTLVTGVPPGTDPADPNKPSAGAGAAPVTTSGLTPEMTAALKFLGWSDAQISSASPSDAKSWAMVGEYLQKQLAVQGQLGEINAAKMNQAYTAALNDPTIKGKYADMQAIDVQNFQQSMIAAQQAADIQSQQYATQFAADQQKLAEQQAAAGTAYSGFRQQAKGILDQSEAGIIQSTRSQLKQNLTQAVNALQAKYGTTQFAQLFPNVNLQYTNPLGGTSGYNPQTGLYGPLGASETVSPDLVSGSLQGTVAPQKESDILAKQQSIYQGLQTPTTAQ